MNTPLPTRLAPFIWHFIKSYKWAVGMFVFLSLVAGAWDSINSLILRHIVDTAAVAAPGDASFLLWPAILIVLNFFILDNLTWRVIGFISVRYLPLIKYRIVHDTYQSTLERSYEYFQNNLSGRIANHITTLSDSIESIIRGATPNFIRGVALVIVALATIASVQMTYFYIVFFWFVAFFTVSVMLSKGIATRSHRHADRESDISGRLVDGIGGVSSIRLFSRRPFELSLLSKCLDPAIVAFRQKDFYMVILHCLQGTLIGIMFSVTLYCLIQDYAAQTITMGDFVMIMNLNFHVGYMSWYTMGIYADFNINRGKATQALDALFKDFVSIHSPNDVPLHPKTGHIQFEQVSFTYPYGAQLFESLSVDITPKSKVGLVGFSGAGKSTFVNLILRFFDVNEGCIKVDGQNISTLDRNSLREHIAMIPQDTALFHRSLMDNIRYGRLDATDEEIIQAAKRAHAHEFIASLDKGYDTLVGERGVKLSGGQRQRIAIARAMLKNAPILILDEATSALDSVTEQHIQSGLQTLMLDRTTIVIAHRLSTLSQMDRILVFDQGKVIEDGPHEDLIKQQGHYAKMWSMQAGGFLPEKGLVEGT